MTRSPRGVIALAFVAVAACATAAMSTATSPSPASAQLHDAMRKLWSDHVVWTRLYIVSAVAGDASAQTAANRLLRNQEDIGNAIVPYYGAAAGTQLTNLLKQHILIAVDLVTAAKAGDQAKVADADRRWHANADDLATFLSGANPNWPKATVLSMLNQHLALTTQEATARIQGRWSDDAATFDSIFNQILGMADALSDGIVKQFPKKARGGCRRHCPEPRVAIRRCAHSKCSFSIGSASEPMPLRSATSVSSPTLPRTTAAFRANPRRLARFIGEPLNSFT